ncbi:hypothetical protein FQN57_006610 [Myotisia sp. PD_48]|nr:hypothetical protein FQN57_006610 [Myotisia sp. PD_48]
MAVSLPCAVLNVFTSKPSGGNALGIVFLSDSKPITWNQKLAIAKKFNYSETIFFHAASSDPAQPRKIDIFTTDQELPFAGHPTIGAASWLLIHSRQDGGDEPPRAITTKAGDIPISLAPNGGGLVSASIAHNVRIHSTKMPLEDMLLLQPSLEPYLDKTQYADGFPVVSIVNGMTIVSARLPSLEALAAVQPTPRTIPTAGVSAGGYLDAGWDEDGLVTTYFHVRDVWDEELQKTVIRSRMMYGDGLEDAATGSAACSLSCYTSLTEAGIIEKGGSSFIIVQGVEMGQRSEIGVEVVLKEGGKLVESVLLQGSAVKISEGTTPSPSGAPLLVNKGPDKTGRKSSLAASLQSIARHTFHSRTRRAGEDAATGTQTNTNTNKNTNTNTAGAARTSSLPVRAKKSFLPRRSTSSYSIEQHQHQHAIPPVPALPTFIPRPSSGLPTTAPAAVSRTSPPMAVHLEGPRVNGHTKLPQISQRKPFVGYQDVQSLSTKIEQQRHHSSGTVTGRENNPDTHAIEKLGLGTRSIRVQRWPPADHPTTAPMPLPKSSSLSLLSASQPGPVLSPLATCKPVYACSGPNAQRCRYPSDERLASYRLLRGSKTLGNLALQDEAHQDVSILSSRQITTIHKEDKSECEKDTVDIIAGNSNQAQRKDEMLPTCVDDNDDVKIVKYSKPQQYWLGRLNTLIASFQHEAAFNEPCPATGFGIAGNQLKGKSPMSINLDEYHTKRAFMVLERVCITDEAIGSLTEFREAYSRRFGSKFLERFAGGVDTGATLSPKGGRKSSAVLKYLPPLTPVDSHSVTHTPHLVDSDPISVATVKTRISLRIPFLDITYLASVVDDKYVNTVSETGVDISAKCHTRFRGLGQCENRKGKASLDIAANHGQ